MNITVICVGKLKEKYWTEAVKEYAKRLGAYCSLEIIELKESRLPDRAGKAEEAAVKKEEGKAILKHIGRDTYVISLEVKGKKLSSEELAKKMADIALSGYGSVSFIIGGSLGLDGAVSERADLRLSFSDMTFPHQMMRVILLEQIYRVFKINRGETYHK